MKNLFRVVTRATCNDGQDQGGPGDRAAPRGPERVCAHRGVLLRRSAAAAPRAAQEVFAEAAVWPAASAAQAAAGAARPTTGR